jgi:hypothetical protein
LEPRFDRGPRRRSARCGAPDVAPDAPAPDAGLSRLAGRVAMTVASDQATPAGAEREIVFHLDGRRHAFPVPPPGDETIPSVFLLSLPKAGSTLLNLMMKPMLTSAGLAYVGLQEVMYRMGVPTAAIPPEVNTAFQPQGYAFGGFRSLPGAFALPPYAGDRTILLVRDPRDMLTSLYFSLARSHRPPGESVGGALAAMFHEKREEVNRQGIDAFALENASVVLAQYRMIGKKLSGIPHKLYRYEDVIFDKLAWAQDMLAWLGLTVKPAVVARAVSNNDVRPEVEDPDKHVRKVAPGDHVEKLRADTIAKLDSRFEAILRRYDYA